MLWLRARSQLKICLTDRHKLEERFAAVIDLEKEIEAAKNEKDQVERLVLNLRSSYSEKKEIYDNLLKEVAIYDENISLAHLGVYSPHFDFTDSDQFKSAYRNGTIRTKGPSLGKDSHRRTHGLGSWWQQARRHQDDKPSSTPEPSCIQ